MPSNPFHSPTAAPSPAPARPASLIVFGVLNILFGLLGLCASAGSSAMFFVDMPQDPRFPNPGLELLRTDATYRLILQTTLVLGAVAAVAAIVGGIGLLLARSWGRTLSIAYGGYAILAGIVGAIVNWVYLVQPLLAQQQQQLAGPAALAAFGGIIGAVVSLIYPVLLLIFMSRPAVRAAVAGRGSVA